MSEHIEGGPDRDRAERSLWGGDFTTDHRMTVHEKERDAKPVLYDHKGQPLTWKRPRLGFGDPREPR
jgi:hypothetical protein